MAKIWLLADGISPTERSPIADRSASWCRKNLNLRKSDWRSPINSPLVINDRTDISVVANPRHVVIMVQEEETGKNWKSGYYYSPSITIDKVRKLLRLN